MPVGKRLVELNDPVPVEKENGGEMPVDIGIERPVPEGPVPEGIELYGKGAPVPVESGIE